MRQITSESGFEYKFEDSVLDNMELIDALAELDEGNTQYITKVCKMLLGDEQRKRLYNHLRTEKGNVPVTAVMKEIGDIFAKLGEGKNS